MTYDSSNDYELRTKFSRRRLVINAKADASTHIVIDDSIGLILDRTEAIAVARALIKTSRAPAVVLDSPLRPWSPDVDAADQAATVADQPADDDETLAVPIEMELRASAVEAAREWYPDADWDVIIDTAHWIVTGERAAR